MRPFSSSASSRAREGSHSEGSSTSSDTFLREPGAPACMLLGQTLDEAFGAPSSHQPLRSRASACSDQRMARKHSKHGPHDDLHRKDEAPEAVVPCWLCGRPTGKTIVWHHPVPRSRGGTEVVP